VVKLLLAFTPKRLSGASFRLSLTLLIIVTLTVITTCSSAFAVTFANVALQNPNNNQGKSLRQEQNALEQTSTAIMLTPTDLTPGQQLMLNIEVNVLDGVEIFFDASQYNWQPFSLVNHSKTEPQWQGDSWTITYTMTLTVPLAGEYHLPKLTLHSYLQQQHRVLTIPEKIIAIHSSFPSNELSAQLQTIEKVKPLDNPTNNSPLSAIIIVIVMLMQLLVYSVRRSALQKKYSTVDKHITSEHPTDLISALIANANKSAEYDWHGLRLYMKQYLSFDPLDKPMNTQHIELSNRYTFARFSSNKNAKEFIEICALCQQATRKIQGVNNA
jgi:hypothetical protein